jgi:hypothetical protein
MAIYIHPCSWIDDQPTSQLLTIVGFILFILLAIFPIYSYSAYIYNYIYTLIYYITVWLVVFFSVI